MTRNKELLCRCVSYWPKRFSYDIHWWTYNDLLIIIQVTLFNSPRNNQDFCIREVHRRVSFFWRWTVVPYTTRNQWSDITGIYQINSESFIVLVLTKNKNLLINYIVYNQKKGEFFTKRFKDLSCQIHNRLCGIKFSALYVVLNDFYLIFFYWQFLETKVNKKQRLHYFTPRMSGPSESCKVSKSYKLVEREITKSSIRKWNCPVFKVSLKRLIFFIYPVFQNSWQTMT